MDDSAFMRRAVELALRGPINTANPRVGCVIVQQNEILAEGWHQGAGTLHAEAHALANAASASVDVKGATAYCSLEPCTHTGRTGPCADALISAGISRVVLGATDPNPVAQGGVQKLRAAGIEVVTGIESTACAQVNRVWFQSVRLRRPVVTWKFAATLDGFSAARDGSSKWITGEAARARVHELRAECDAILVGTGTVLADDPHLTVRCDGVLCPVQPLRVVMGLRDIPVSAKVLDDCAETFQVHTRDPLMVLEELSKRQIRHVWLEGGSVVAAAFLAADLVDEIHAFIAPSVLGAGLNVVSDLGINNIADMRSFNLHSVSAVGGDVHVTCVRQGVFNV